jgi:uncharacterized protein YjbI with pentapeptide repeats
MGKSDPSLSADDMSRVEKADAGEAKSASDLDAIRKAVEDAASVSTGLWISYLFMFFYIALAAGAVTHLDLLLENSVKLPFLGIELPLFAFFLIAPLLFLIVHAYTLVHFVMLGQKSAQFNAAIRVAEDSDDKRRQLPSNIFVQFLAGPSDVRNTAFGQLLRAIAWITLVFGPIALLLELQIQFLPYHHLQLTWEHRLALLVDILLIWWLWHRIVGRSDRLISKDWRSRTITATGAILSALALWLSWSLAIIPNEWQQFTGCPWLYKHLFHGEPNPHTHRPTSLFSNRLVLPRLNVYDILKVDDPQKAAWRPYLLSLRGRDLKGAILDEAFLPRTDAQFAQLQGASLAIAASLQGSILRDASLQGADLSTAQLQGADLIRAQLDGATLSGAGLQGATLEAAHLVGADLTDAQLQGANFRGADLRGAFLVHAALRGTAFGPIDHGQIQVPTQLQGANFDQATLDVVSLDRALLWRSVFAGDGELAKLKNISGTPVWAPMDINGSWGPDSYKTLQDKSKALPKEGRDRALSNIAILDCAQTGPTIASCDPAADVPMAVSQWQNEIKNATLNRASYTEALASVYLDLVCSGDGNSLAIVRSLAKLGVPEVAGGATKAMGFLEAGADTARLVDSITSNQCYVAAQLTDTDKVLLLTVKRLAAPADTSTNNPTPQK